MIPSRWRGPTTLDEISAQGDAVGLQAGKCGVERIDETAYPVVVRLYDRIGKARVRDSHYIVHVRDGRVSYLGITYPRARVSPGLRQKAERITEPDPNRAVGAVFDDITRRTGKDPRTSFWFQEGVRVVPLEKLADLTVVPEENLLFYEVKLPGRHTGAPHIYWVDAETFEIRTSKLRRP